MKRKGGFSQRGGGGGGGKRGGRGGGGGMKGRGGIRGRASNGSSQRGRHHPGYRTPDPDPPAALKPAKPMSSNESSDEEFEEPVDAYTSFLQTLQATSGTFAKAYAQRQREEQGGSDSSEEEEAGVDIEAEAGSEADSELEDNSDVESEGADENNEDSEAANEDSNAIAVGDLEGESNSEESEWEEVDGDAVEEEVAIAEISEEGSDSENLTAAASASACTDPFKSHMERELTNDEIAELVAGKAKFKTEVVAAGVPHAKWVTNMPAFPKEEKELVTCVVKSRLQKHWQKLPGDKQCGDFKSEQQAQFFSYCNSYQDVLHSQRCGPQGHADLRQEHQNSMDAYILHILNHVLKTRDLVTRNNEKVQRQQANEDRKRSTDFVDLPRDQGFTRPKVLMMLPLRSTALKFVKRLIELAPSSQTVDVEHKSRFFDDFGVDDDEDSGEDGNGKEDEAAGEQESNGFKSRKPADFKALFSGNNDDHFRIGVKFTRKSIKLYSDFYSSDIIIASPIGLVTRIGEAESAKKEDKQDVDFLSSIEIAVLDYADVILMQNWSHVMSVFDHLNCIPTQQHGTDFMRIREWYLNGHSRNYRQTIILSAFPDAGINALFHRTCVNHAGKVKLRCDYSGLLSKVVLQVRQVYERIECQTITEIDDARFEFFTKQIFPRIRDSLQGGILLFTRSYFDFVRLRNFLKSQNSSFCLLGEYTKQSDISRGRSWFFHQKRRIMLYTERAHFYHRYKIRGIRDLIFYSLPDHAHFYSEMSNLLEGVENPSCTVLFSKFDNLQLERIVGSSRSHRMLNSENRTFMFC